MRVRLVWTFTIAYNTCSGSEPTSGPLAEAVPNFSDLFIECDAYSGLGWMKPKVAPKTSNYILSKIFKKIAL
jgi:hypothetical protein